MKRFPPLMILPALLLLVAGGCEESPTGTDDINDEAQAFLHTTLPEVVAGRDATGYASLLHDDFRFLFVQGEGPGDLPADFWGKRTEAAVMESLLTSPSVTDVQLDISLISTVLAESPGEPGVWMMEAWTLAGLGVSVAAAEGDTTHYVAAEIQLFLLRKEADGAEWKIYEQAGGPTSAKGAEPGTEEITWGGLKRLFYAPLDPPATRTVKGTVSLESEETPAEGAWVVAGGDSVATDSYGRFTMSGVPSTVSSIACRCAGAAEATYPVGGGDDVYRIELTLHPELTLAAANAWLADFAEAYAARDSAAYASFLDSAYQFQLLPEDADPSHPDQDWWDRETELLIAGRMFNGWENEDECKVYAIDLTLYAKTVGEDHTPYPNKPAGETWYLVNANVDLVVTADYPYGDQYELIYYIVLSEQQFILRPDPSGPSGYRIARQKDRPFINKGLGALASGTEDSSWGAVKSLWR